MKVTYAEYIRVGYCGECDGLHLQLHDDKGRVFAVAVLDQNQASQVGEECAEFVKHGASARASEMARRAGRLQ